MPRDHSVRSYLLATWAVAQWSSRPLPLHQPVVQMPTPCALGAPRRSIAVTPAEPAATLSASASRIAWTSSLLLSTMDAMPKNLHVLVIGDD